jgi:hypothetical protein
MKRFIVAAVVLFAVPVAHAAQPGAAAGAPFRAGAARIDFTPEQLPRNMVGVLDPIFVRALVLDNGSTRAALVSVDAGSISNDLFAKVSARAAQELNIPATQLMISATHTHSVPFQGAGNAEEKIMQGLRESVARLQPARVAWGTGQSSTSRLSHRTRSARSRRHRNSRRMRNGSRDPAGLNASWGVF